MTSIGPPYLPAPDRYEAMPFRRSGGRGLRLPVVSLGLWQNFGDTTGYATQRQIVLHAVDRGVVHLDLANNYGPPYGAAEANLGRLLARDLRPYRDELVIATKAGYDMWPGPYGDGGSRKYLLSSLDRSLQRLGLDHVDVFYHHRPDPETPLEETVGALHSAVTSGRALYVGLSNYPADVTARAAGMLAALGTPLLVHQQRYSMLDRTAEDGLLEVLAGQGAGCVAFSPLAQGLLTDRYLHGVPDGSRAARGGTLGRDEVARTVPVLRALNDVATAREQTLAGLAVSWVLRDPRMTSVIVGASSTGQLDDVLAAAAAPAPSAAELATIDGLLDRLRSAGDRTPGG